MQFLQKIYFDFSCSFCGYFFYKLLSFSVSLIFLHLWVIQITILIEVRKKGFFDAVFAASRKGFLIFPWLENEQLQSSYKVSGLEVWHYGSSKFQGRDAKLGQLMYFLTC